MWPSVTQEGDFQASRVGVLPLYVSKHRTNKRPYGDLGSDNTVGA